MKSYEQMYEFYLIVLDSIEFVPDELIVSQMIVTVDEPIGTQLQVLGSRHRGHEHEIGGIFHAKPNLVQGGMMRAASWDHVMHIAQSVHVKAPTRDTQVGSRQSENAHYPKDALERR